MSIFKDSFKPGVKAQLTARQDALGDTSRSSSMIQYFNSRNAWIRMSSSVDVKGDGGALASKYILQGGTLTNAGFLAGTPLLVPKSGVGSGNQAYSTTTPGGKLNRLGIRPMPGITSLDVKSKSAYGSLREANVSFQCWDIRQLEELEQLYMRPGYSVLVEWGWAPYLDNSGNLQPNVPLINYLFQKKPKEQIWSETFSRASKDGNYDAVYGLVKNYSWKARSDGGYDCSVSIITMGEVLESLKINYGAFDKANLQTQGLFPVASPASAFASSATGATVTSAILSAIGSAIFTSGGFAAGTAVITAASVTIKDDVSSAYAQNIVAGICAELYNLAVENAPATDEAYWPLKDTNNSGYVYNFIKYKVQMSSSGPTITDGTTQIYIKLADFIEILNHYVLLSDKKNKTPLAKLSVHEPDATYSGGKGNPLLCLGNIHQISTNPHVCLIRNEAYEDPKTNLGVDGLDVTSVKKYLSVMTAFNYLNLSTEFGEIGNIFVNLDYLYGLSLNDTLAEKDKKEKNDIVLFDYIKSMMSGINTAIGNVANFDIFIDPVDSVARIIDVNYVDTTKRSDAYTNAFQIEVHNLNSTVRDYSLESQIFPEQSTMVAIGAQVKGGALGTNTDTLVDYNKGLVDRVIPQKDAPTAPPNSSVTDELAKLKALQDNWAIIADLFIQLNPDWFSAGDYDVEESSKYANALKDIINYFNSIISSNTKNRAIIPTKLSLTMDGIGGMIIGNMFKINDDVLPSGYKGKTISSDIGSRIGYVVTGLGHKINNNDWTTQVDAQFVVLDEPKGIDKSSLPTVIAINRAVTAAAATTPPGGGSPPAGRTGCAMGSNAVNPGVDFSQPAENSGIDFSTFVYPCNGTVTSLFVDRRATLGNIHRALDIAAPTGTPVYSVCDGEVAVVGAGGYGPNALYIKVDKKYHPGKTGPYYFIYGHLDTNIVRVGDKVTTKQQIGTVGNKGMSTGPHLHLQLKNNTGPDAAGTSYIYGKYFPGNTGCAITALDPWGGVPTPPPLTPAANALRVKAIAEEIKAATVDAWGTKSTDFIAAVKKINDKQTFVDVNAVLGTLVTGLDFKKVLNDELGNNDVPTAKAIRDHLLPFGVDINYKYTGNDVTSNSFTVTVK
jgi:murein DD-endopeptidase MepM/ murein hydrolase activator NlpD